VGVACRDDDSSAAFKQALSNGSTDTARAARDERAFTGEFLCEI
jgi:hypothetical protein